MNTLMSMHVFKSNGKPPGFRVPDSLLCVGYGAVRIGHMAQEPDQEEGGVVVAKRLTEARCKSGLTRSDAARLAGMPYRTLEQYEKGVTKGGPQAVALIKLAKLYRVTSDWLLGLEDSLRHVISQEDVIADVELLEKVKLARSQKEADSLMGSGFLFAFHLPSGASVFSVGSVELGAFEAAARAEMVRLQYLKPGKSSGEIRYQPGDEG